MDFLSNNWSTFLFIAALVVLTLGIYAFRLLLQLKSQKQQQDGHRSKLVREGISSIDTIIAATLQQQCNVSESVLRISAILQTINQYHQTTIELDHYPSVKRLLDEVSKHPILEARKQLAKKERMRLDLTRETLEAELENEILKELAQIRRLLNKIVF